MGRRTVLPEGSHGGEGARERQAKQAPLTVESMDLIAIEEAPREISTKGSGH